MFTVSPIIGQHFAFAHGRTGVLQQSLLLQSDVDRLLGTHDRHAMQQVLTELRFTKLIDQSLREEEAILAACQAWVRREVTSMTPKKLHTVFDILWIEGDLPLLSYLLKERKRLTSSVGHCPEPPYSAYDPVALRALVEHDKAGDLPDNLVAFVRHMQGETVSDPRLIDAAVAQYGADSKLSLARKSGSFAITRFVRHHIDTQNIRTVLRFASDDRNVVLPHILRGGTMSPESLVSSGSVATAVRKAGFYGLADSLEDPAKDKSAVERALNGILAEDISVLWNLILSVESLFAFATTALSQISLLRAIIIGKRNNMPPQDIKQMMPQFLSASHYVV